MGYQLGVDLGTTYTAAAVFRDGKATIFSLGGRAASIPSVVHLREDETVLTGDAAVRRSITEPGRVAREFKRRLGDSAPIIVGGTPYSAEALMARLLKYVIAEVQKREGSAPDQIGICHPANWGQYKIDLLNQAIRLAGIPPDRVNLLTEPEAAAISYSTNERVEPGEIVAVYDLGGGTFDAAVLRKTETGFEIMGRPEGIERLGGIDFDSAVFAHVSRMLGTSLAELDEDDPMAIAAVARLRADCVDAKEALSSDTDATIPVMLPNFQTEVRITRIEFESLIRPALADSIEAMERALSSAGVTPDQVSRVLLVGGSSRIPLISQMVGAGLGRPVAVDAHPKHAIALGAANAAANLGGTAATGSVPSAPTTETTEVPAVPVPGPTGASVAPPASPPEPPPEVVKPSTPSTPEGPPAKAEPAKRAPAPVSSPVTKPDPVPAAAAMTPSPSGGGPNKAMIGGVAAVALLVVGFLGFKLLGGSDDGGTEVATATTTIDGATTDGQGDNATTSTTGTVEEETTSTEAEVLINDAIVQGAIEVLDAPQDDVSAAIDGTTVVLSGVVTDEASWNGVVTVLEGFGAEVDVSELTVLPEAQRCTDSIQANAHWVCLIGAELSTDGTLTIDYISGFGTDPFDINDPAGYHLHIFSGDLSLDQAGTPGSGPWQIWDTPDEAIITAASIGLGESTETICARIAFSSTHALEDGSSGATGQCVRLQRPA